MRLHDLAPLSVVLIAVAVIGLPRPGQEPAREAARSQEVAPTVVEKETGYEFPTWLDHFEGENRVRHVLLGTGVREKTIFMVNVYGMAMYANKEELGRHCVELAKKLQPRKAGTDKRLAAKLLDGKVSLSMRWIMARDVEAEDVREAFEDWLEPRLKTEVAKEKDADKRAALKTVTAEKMATFRGFFSVDLVKGDELIFIWETDGSLHTIIRGEAQPVVTSKQLCRALFDCYLGPDAAEPKARKAFVTGAWRLARVWKPPVESDETTESAESKD